MKASLQLSQSKTKSLTALFLAMVMACALPLSLRGQQTLTVYDETATNQYIPMYGFYFDDFTKSECIIPASQLTAMNGGTITAITFYPSTVGTTNTTWGASSQTVFLKEVSSTTISSYSGMSGATTVKTGLLTMPTAGQAYTITFSTPYTYNGGNLLIGIYNTTDGSYNKVECTEQVT